MGRWNTAENRPYLCPDCPLRFDKKLALQKHIKRKHLMVPVHETCVCTECGKQFRSLAGLQHHRRCFADGSCRVPISPVSCDKCGRNFKYWRNLRVHVCNASLTGNEPFHCEFCWKTFKSRGYMMKHQRMHSVDRPFLCPDCGKSFKTKDSLAYHAHRHTEGAYLCQLCGKRLKFPYGYKLHLMQHAGTKPFRCSHCDERFGSTYQRNKHVNEVHLKSEQNAAEDVARRQSLPLKPQLMPEDRRVYTCTVCNQDFAFSSNLRRHVRGHSGEKRFSCDRCSKSFTNSVNLKHHVLRHDVDKNAERTFVCDICPKAFHTAYDLKYHVRMHSGAMRIPSGDGLHLCVECGKQFRCASNLRTHMNSHAGVMQHPCDYCGREFSLVGNRNQHMKLHCKSAPNYGISMDGKSTLKRRGRPRKYVGTINVIK